MNSVRERERPLGVSVKRIGFSSPRRSHYLLLALAFLGQSCVTTYENGVVERPSFFDDIRRMFKDTSLPEWKADEVEPFMFYKPPNLPLLLAPVPAGEIPSHVQIQNLLPVLDQGTLPAGPVFSAGYVATTLLIRSRQSAYRCSPAFIFRMLNGSDENPVEILDVLRFLQNTGCSNWVHHPFTGPQDYSRQPGESVIRDAQNFRIGGFARVDLRDADQIRNHLLAGRPVIVSMVFPENLLSLRDNEFDWPKGKVVGRQSVAVVGLDSERRLVLVQNSMGERWGRKGLAWISLDWFVRLVIDAYVVY